MYRSPYMYPYPYYAGMSMYPAYPTGMNTASCRGGNPTLTDYGNRPFVINIKKAAEQNRTFRTALWTGKHLQVTVMNINVGEDIGLEVHPDGDQFLLMEEGEGIVQMGNTKMNLNFRRQIGENDAIMIPAGAWHNIINTGNRPLKLYTIYAPPEHPYGTVHPTKQDALAADDHYH